MAYYTFPPPFYSSSTPPFYSTSTNIPLPLSNPSFSHGYTTPSPNPYTPSSPNLYPSFTSYSNPYGYGYSSYYNSNQHQPYSTPVITYQNMGFCVGTYSSYSSPQYANSTPYTNSYYVVVETVDSNPSTSLQTRREALSLVINGLRDMIKILSTPWLPPPVQTPPGPSLAVTAIKTPVSGTTTSPPLVSRPSPPTSIPLGILGASTPSESYNTASLECLWELRSTEDDMKVVNHAPSLPPPKPPELVAIPLLNPSYANITLTPPPKPPDVGFQRPIVESQVSCDPTRPLPPLKPPNPTPDTNATPSPPPKPPDLSFSTRPPPPHCSSFVFDPGGYRHCLGLLVPLLMCVTVRCTHLQKLLSAALPLAQRRGFAIFAPAFFCVSSKAPLGLNVAGLLLAMSLIGFPSYWVQPGFSYGAYIRAQPSSVVLA